MMKRAKKVKIFCGYDSMDEALLDKFETHLNLLGTSGQIEMWSERETLAGAPRQQEIEKHLKEADIALLLVSPQFLVSHHGQMTQATNLHKANKISYVIPILIRYSGWEQSPIGKLQPLPRNRRPIKQWKDRDEAFVHVVGEIKKVVDLLLSEPQQPSEVRDGLLFIGQFPTNGYRWDNDLRLAPGSVKQKIIPDAPWLVSQAIGLFELSQRYSIFDEPNVLRDFAGLSPTAEAIQQFANRYGYLADGDLVPLSYPDGKPDNKLWAGESLQFWTKEIREVNMLVTLWEMIKDKQIEALREHIIWKRDPMGVLFVWQYPDIPIPKGAVIASERKSFEDGDEDKKEAQLYQWKWGEVIRPALYYLAREINAHMQGHINSTLFPSSEMEMYMVPDGLRSALYVLLAMEVREHTIEAE